MQLRARPAAAILKNPPKWLRFKDRLAERGRRECKLERLRNKRGEECKKIDKKCLFEIVNRYHNYRWRKQKHVPILK
jgi:hypothetical protein